MDRYKGDNSMKRNKGNTFLWFFSIFFFLVCLVEGILYYHNKIDNVFLSIALNIQNAIKAFMLDSEINIDDAMELINSTDFSYFKNFITYLYVITIVLAPFCTIAVLFMLIKRPIYFIEGFLKSRKDKLIIIFGEGENKENFIKSIKSSCRIIVYEKLTLSEDRALKYLRDGITYFTDIRQGDKQVAMLKKAKLHKADYILMCDDNPLQNLDYMKMVTEFFDQVIPKNKELICYIQCQEYGMNEVIQNYYDSLGKTHFDLSIVDIKQKAVNKMFMEHRLYEYNKISNSKDVHLAIIGFGDYGQNTLIQALNNGVFSSDSTICIDVYDRNIDSILGVFLKKFSSDILDGLKEKVPVGDVYADYVIEIPFTANNSFIIDGKVIMRFWKVDVSTIQFTKVLSNCISNYIFTYVVIAINEKTLMAATLLEIKRNLPNDIPIIVRTTDNEQSFNFLSSVDKYKNIHLIHTSKDIFSMEALRNEDIINMAKDFNKNYIEIESDNKRQASEWMSIPVFKRESAIAQAMHQDTKEWLLGDGKIVDEHGALEHRRWCLFMISNGYKYSYVKNAESKTNPCICTWDKLYKDMPDMLQHDFMPFRIIESKRGNN